MDHHVAYHSIERMGHDYQPDDYFGYESRKSEKTLRAALGSTTWLIVGRRESKRTRYFLAGNYSPSRIKALDDRWLIEGWGVPLSPPTEITELPWFLALVREQSNFSFGFNRVRDADAIAGLESLVPTINEVSRAVLRVSAAAEQNNRDFDVQGMTDARERVIASMVRRQGQPAFRSALMRAYDSRCAFSGCAVEDVLEAAHIVPYQGEDTNHVQNGLLLRSDLHALFDLGLLAVDSETLNILVAPALAGSEYAEMAGRMIRAPQAPECRPSVDALTHHRVRAGF